VISEERWQSYRKLIAEVNRHALMTNPVGGSRK
jgi:hypothetical protein